MKLRVQEGTTELRVTNESTQDEITEHRTNEPLQQQLANRERTQEEIKQHNRELAALRAIATAMMQSALGLDEVLQRIADGLTDGLGCDTAFILLLDEREAVFKGAAVSTRDKLINRIEDLAGCPLAQIQLPAQSDFNEAVSNALVGRMTIKHDLYELAGPLLSRPVCHALQGLHGSKTFLSMPLQTKGKVVGGIVASTTREEISEAEKATITTLASQAAMAIENARLYQQSQRELAERKRMEEELQDSLERLRKALEGTIRAIALTVETRDPYTAGHQRRVADLARAIATEMGLSRDQIDGIRMAGVIHDIGKISVPGEILSRPGRLNVIEFSLIKTHPQIGYDILKTIDFPWPVAQIVVQHHERMNGSGYPAGLSGEEILLEARILGVADVVEAMSSHRPYRSALGIYRALEEISQNRGVLYDPEVVDACLKLFTEKGFKLK
jgi:putative nucleotidyltransferase with HDIG domain